MDLRQLRYYVAVAEERHFGRAAERLHMAQPPLSQQIKQLETELGTVLLERTTRRVDLTPAGALLLDRARQVLADVDALTEDVQEVGRGAAGVLRVGFVGSASLRVVPALVRGVREHLPGVRLQMSGEMLTPQMEEELLANRLDVALLRPPVASSELSVQHLADDSLVVALPLEHPLAAGHGPLSLDELRGQDLVSYPARSVVAAATMEAFHRAGLRSRVVQEAGETSTLLTFVASGMGLAVVPDGVSSPHSRRLRFRPVDGLPPVGLAVAWKTGNSTALVTRFRRLLAELPVFTADDDAAAAPSSSPTPRRPPTTETQSKEPTP